MSPIGPVYLDHNATTPVRPEVVSAVAEALAIGGNPSSVHAAGRAARARLEAARSTVAAFLGAPVEGVVFTSGATEANNLALLGLPGRKLVSAIEHPSVLEAVTGSISVPVTADGLVDLEGLESLLALHRPALVSVMAASNETGVLQPIGAISRAVHAAGALLHVDAVQAIGRVPFDMTALAVDLCSVSAHKIGGPPGIGALVLRSDLDLAPLARGGGQERRRRAGTENLAGAIGLATALCAVTDWPRIAQWRDRLEREALAIAAGACVVGVAAPRLPNTTCLVTPGIAAQTQLMALDLEGVCVSAGAACSSGRVGPSHVLAALGLPAELARCAIRVSLGWTTTEADVDRFLDAYLRLVRRIQG